MGIVRKIAFLYGVGHYALILSGAMKGIRLLIALVLITPKQIR
jgi:hypothetical protein